MEFVANAKANEQPPSPTMHKAIVDARDDFAILIFKGRADYHEDHRARSAGLLIYFRDSRPHHNPSAGADRRDEIDFHPGRQASRTVRKLLKRKFRESENSSESG